ncbi:MAG TPA: class I SAM-dependent methyltransferase [Thermomicrobiales bacterium]|nr:class I SAM-dependent methyltransferase [Thermomicrobiales bacterium]
MLNDNALSLIVPSRVASSGWLEHTPFGLQIIDLLRPRVLVELGTYTGVSYCSFCQAVRAVGCDTRCYAIDTWQGDPQTGHYGVEVLQDLRAHHDPLYGSFSQLVQSSFDDELSHFSDGSIDLLHIDGHHTYESVKHDFESWLPKMSSHGVILLHDTNVREGDFGVWQLWEEQKPHYPHFEFVHSHGLGLLVAGQEPPEPLRRWLVAAGENPGLVREYYAQLGRRVQLRQDLAELRQEYDRIVQAVQQHERLIQDQERALAALSAQHEAERKQLEAHAEASLAAQQAQYAAERARQEAESSQEIATWQARALAAEAAHTALWNTRSMRVVAGWWRVKAGVAEQVAHGTTRSQMLLERSAYMWHTEGALAVAGRLGRWLRGERRYYGPNALVRTSQVEQSRQVAAADRLLALGAAPGENGAAGPDTLGRTRLRAFLAAGQRLSFPAVDQPLVSIVIPVHDQAQHTYLTLENLLATTQAMPTEVLVSDDASTDETADLLARVDNVRVQRNDANLGFGETCNRGAALAQGKYLCFLNNDALPMPGWLDALVAIAEGDPLCGAVGAKIVFPDARLQEAGSIIWRDGSALGYGRGQDAFAPEYSYRREVDYCSAACLLVRADLFRDLGGFDPRYAPAYYEDVDLCMAIRQAGYHVVLAHRAVVLHREHGTSGRGTAVALQLRNREAFVAKWRDQLAAQSMPGPLEVLRRRDSRAGKRVLILDDMVPQRQLGSGFPRTLALVQGLVEAGDVLTYLPATDPRPYEPATTNLQDAGVEVLYGVSDIPAQLAARAGLYDAVIVSRPHNAGLIAAAREANPDALIVYDAEAVFALRDARQAEVEGRPFSAEALEARVREEFALAASADLVLTVSQVERRAIERYFPDLPVAVWGHAMSLQDAGADFRDRSGLAFVGYLTSAPNNDALIHLLRDILPAVFAECDCRLVIAGTGALPEARAAGERDAARITWAGFVEDLRTVFDRCRVFVAPHRFAAGIPIKVIEAMAYGVPCVISPLLAEQHGVTDGGEALVAEDAREFGEKVVRLHQDEALWLAIQRNARAFVAANFDPAAMARAVTELIEDRSLSPAGIPSQPA